MIIICLVKENACIRENFIAIIDSQPRSDDSCNEFSVVRRPATIRWWIWFAGSNFLFDSHVPNLHFSIEVSKASETDKSSQISPKNGVFMLLSKLKDNLIVFCEKNRLSRHKSTDNKVMLSFAIPFEVMDWSWSSFYLKYFIFLVAIDVQTIFSIIRFSSWIIIGLKFD